jgi:hypothetical protein
VTSLFIGEFPQESIDIVEKKISQVPESRCFEEFSGKLFGLIGLDNLLG